MPLTFNGDWESSKLAISRELEQINQSIRSGKRADQQHEQQLAEMQSRFDLLTWKVSVVSAAGGVLGGWLLPRVGEWLVGGVAHAAASLASG